MRTNTQGLLNQCPILLILCLDGLKHSIIQVTRFDQARQKQASLCCMWVQTVLECSHRHILLCSMRMCQVTPAGWRQFTHLLESSGPLAAFW